MKKLILMLTLALTACGGDSSSSSDKGSSDTVFDMWAMGDGILNFRGMVLDINYPFGFTTDDTKCMCDIQFMGYENRGSIIISACTGDATYMGYTHASTDQICRDTFHGITRYEVEGGILTLTDDENTVMHLPRY